MNTIPQLCLEFYRKSGAAGFGIDEEEFSRILDGVIGRCLGPRSSNKDRASFLKALKVEELALAQGCARGNAAAWERFALHHGGRLQTIALGITREESSARELAGSLYSILFGSHKLLSYSGRGSLEGWLRAVLAQEHVNQMRAGKRLTSYEAEIEAGVQFREAIPEATAIPDGRLAESVDAALGTLKPEEQFVLASYYLDGRTMAEVGRAMGVHESTVSRRIEKLVATLRKRTLRELRIRGVSSTAAEEMLGSDVRDVELDVGRRLMEAPPSRSGARE